MRGRIYKFYFMSTAQFWFKLSFSGFETKASFSILFVENLWKSDILQTHQANTLVCAYWMDICLRYETLFQKWKIVYYSTATILSIMFAWVLWVPRTKGWWKDSWLTTLSMQWLHHRRGTSDLGISNLSYWTVITPARDTVFIFARQ